jgi:hypothetical protein
MNPDLTPIATEHAQLAAFKAQADALGWTPPKAVAVADTAAVEALLDASFEAGYHRCACGAMIVADETRCYPCTQGQRERGPIYGASLAGHTPVPGDALRAVEAVWLTPVDACRACAAATERIDALLDQNDAQAIENSDLARQVISLKGHLETMAAQVRQGKAGT